MNGSGFPIVSAMIALPVLGAIVQMLGPRQGGTDRKLAAIKAAGLASSAISSVLAIALVATMKKDSWEPQAVEAMPWLGSYGITYEVAVDGMNALVVLLLAVAFPMVILSEWKREEGVRGIFGLLLLLQTSLLGTACAQDLFLLFFFWAMSAIPVYFLVSVWGREKKEENAFRYIVTSSAGNALVFATFVLVYYAVVPNSFAIRHLLGGKVGDSLVHLWGAEISVSRAGFFLLCAGLALRVPIWPLHGWFTQLARNAPFSLIAAFSGAFVPVGLYVFSKVGFSLFPAEMGRYAGWIIAFGIANMVIGALCATAQADLRLVTAYVAIAEVGFVMIGLGSLDPAGVVGAVYQILVVGLGLTGLALFTGMVWNRSGHSHLTGAKGAREIGGMVSQAPVMALMTGLVISAILGIPGLGGFVGQSLIMMGGYAVHPAVIAALCGGVLFLTAALFTVFRGVFLGEASPKASGFSDLSTLEKSYLVPLAGALVWLGIGPKPLLDLIRPSVLTLLSVIK